MGHTTPPGKKTLLSRNFQRDEVPRDVPVEENGDRLYNISTYLT
jgi:hypothetical protein